MKTHIKKRIESDKKFADGVEKLEPVFRYNFLNGNIKVEKNDIQILGEMPNLKKKCVDSIEKLNEMVKVHKEFIVKHPDWKTIYGIID